MGGEVTVDMALSVRGGSHLSQRCWLFLFGWVLHIHLHLCELIICRSRTIVGALPCVDVNEGRFGYKNTGGRRGRRGPLFMTCWWGRNES